MLLAGDEFGRTQQGNNNAYCQDNEISWLDWDLGRRQADLCCASPSTVRAAAQISDSAPQPFPDRATMTRNSDVKDLTWINAAARRCSNPIGTIRSRTASACSSTAVRGRPVCANGAPRRRCSSSMNAYHDFVEFTLPVASGGGSLEAGARYQRHGAGRRIRRGGGRSIWGDREIPGGVCPTAPMKALVLAGLRTGIDGIMRPLRRFFRTGRRRDVFTGPVVALTQGHVVVLAHGHFLLIRRKRPRGAGCRSQPGQSAPVGDACRKRPTLEARRAARITAPHASPPRIIGRPCPCAAATSARAERPPTPCRRDRTPARARARRRPE